MKSVVIDKIASVTSNCRIGREARLGADIACREGDVVAVRVKTSKSSYDQLELVTGRFSRLKPGDVVAGALGHRNALRGFAGRMPESLAPGDAINILNLGGVLGHYEGGNPSVGRPFECEVLGQVLSFPYVGKRVGVPANITQGALDRERVSNGHVPAVVALAGSAMDSGKTLAATALIQELTRRRYRVSAAKVTGVSLRRDILAMEDAGAGETVIFTDFGVVTTTRESAPALARAMIARLARRRPDILVLELGDGLLGSYGVDAILADPVFQKHLDALVFCATDPVAAWGGIRHLEERFGLTPAAITGPATDNQAGSSAIRALVDVPCANAMTDAGTLADHVLAALGAAGARTTEIET